MRKHIRTVSNLWKCSDHAHTRAKNRAVAEFQRLLLLLLTNMRFLEDRMVALKTGQGRDEIKTVCGKMIIGLASVKFCNTMLISVRSEGTPPPPGGVRTPK